MSFSRSAEDQGTLPIMAVDTEQAAEAAIQYASEGTGPLLQRDYLAAIKGVDASPEDVAIALRTRFCEFAPSETARFESCRTGHGPLEVGDEMNIRIALLGLCKVRVVHVGPCSITLRTLAGHPEAGRITFGSYREGGKLFVRIRSRTRQAGLLKYLGFLLLGKQLQARCWIKFLWKLAETLGGTVDGTVHVSTKATKDRPADWGDGDLPTFSVRGGDLTWPSGGSAGDGPTRK